MQAIDLRSDTVTRPTAGMCKAMDAAALGDDANYAATVTNLIATKATPGKAIAMSLVFG